MPASNWLTVMALQRPLHEKPSLLAESPIGVGAHNSQNSAKKNVTCIPVPYLVDKYVETNFSNFVNAATQIALTTWVGLAKTLRKLL